MTEPDNIILVDEFNNTLITPTSVGDSSPIKKTKKSSLDSLFVDDKKHRGSTTEIIGLSPVVKNIKRKKKLIILEEEEDDGEDINSDEEISVDSFDGSGIPSDLQGWLVDGNETSTHSGCSFSSRDSVDDLAPPAKKSLIVVGADDKRQRLVTKVYEDPNYQALMYADVSSDESLGSTETSSTIISSDSDFQESSDVSDSEEDDDGDNSSGSESS